MRQIAALFVSFAVGACALSPANRLHTPKVLLEYGYLLDRECTQKRPEDEFASVRREIRERLPEFQADWDAHGVPLLNVATKLVAWSSPFNEIRPALISCGLPSMSAPLLINIRHRITSGGGTDWPEGHGINNVIFHELLHRYVVAALDSLPNRTTPLLEKYKDEEPIVRNHLHLYAVEQATYDAAGLSDVLEEIKRHEMTFPSWPAKQVALEIVAKETKDAFIEELGGTE